MIKSHTISVDLQQHDSYFSDSPKEECGVVGIYAPGREAARLAFFSLFALQHRGQESAGIAVSDGSVVRMKKDMGLVTQVFDEDDLKGLPGHLAIGHNRYSTMGASVVRNAGPFFCQSLVGDVAVAHNGNLVNADALRKELIDLGEVFDSTSDSELLARLYVRNLDKGVEDAVAELMKKAKGAYSCTVVTPTQVLGFRDPYGIRPLAVGKLNNGYVLASESCAFAPIDAEFMRELEPGEMAIIDADGLRFACGAKPERKSMCMFEFIYFARPDSQMYGTLLYAARERMGANLAKEHPADADIVIPVPDSGVAAALAYAEESGIPYREGMLKNRYIHRTFIQPDDEMRKNGVRMKLAPLSDHLVGKRVVLVDDSIVRGTTTGQIVKLLKKAGASEVHVRITAPPIMWPCFYGIDMASKKQLIAANMSVDSIKDQIGADSLGYLSINGVVSAVGRPEDEFCLACFSGKYPLSVKEFHPDAFESGDESPSNDTGEMVAVNHSQLGLFDEVGVI